MAAKKRRFKLKDPNRLQQYRADNTGADGLPVDVYDPAFRDIAGIPPVFKQFFTPNAETDVIFKECIFTVDAINDHNTSTLSFDPTASDQREERAARLIRSACECITRAIDARYQHPERDLVELLLQGFFKTRIIEIALTSPRFAELRKAGRFRGVGAKFVASKMALYIGQICDEFVGKLKKDLTNNNRFRRAVWLLKNDGEGWKSRAVKNRRRFNTRFRARAVQRYRETGRMRSTAREFGVDVKSLFRWQTKNSLPTATTLAPAETKPETRKQKKRRRAEAASNADKS